MAGLGKTQPRLGVAFSSGFFGFFAHAGFLAALRELEITPSAYSGASSGAIRGCNGRHRDERPFHQENVIQH